MYSAAQPLYSQPRVPKTRGRRVACVGRTRPVGWLARRLVECAREAAGEGVGEVGIATSVICGCPIWDLLCVSAP
eukprot:6358675-Prymnesium_polylepis.1